MQADSRTVSDTRTFRQSLCAMLGLSTIVMMVAIDQTVVGTALPTIVAELKGFNLYAWVATAYLLTSVITVPVFGRLGDWYGRKRLIVIGIVVFTVASILCGAAWNMTSLVLFRGMQGVGGGMLVGTAFASIPDLFPDPVVRLRWQVIFSSAFGIANAIGPSLGGILSQHYGWRFVFFVNVPIGICSLYLAAAHMPDIRHMHAGKMRLDWRGALLIAVALGTLQRLVEALGSQGIGAQSLCYAGVVVVSVVLLFREERRAFNPIIPPAMLSEPGMITLLVLSVLMGIALFSLLVYVPLLLQGGAGLSAQRAGLAITPLVFCITIGTITNTRVVTRMRRPNTLLYLGYCLLALACWGVATLMPNVSGWIFTLGLVAGGIGIGFVMPNLTVFAQQVAGKRQLGIATALIQSARMIGGMIGTALVGTIVKETYVARMSQAPQMQSAKALAPWAGKLSDPQTLIDADRVSGFIDALHKAGVDGTALMQLARATLTHAIQLSFFVVTAGMVLAALAVALLPLIQLRSFSNADAPIAQRDEVEPR